MFLGLVKQIILKMSTNLLCLGCEDIRPLFEKLNEFNIELPVDLAIRPFSQKDTY